jgi:hypothetical protein
MNLKPNCFEKTEVRWGIFSFFSSTKVETKNVCPIAYNVLRLAEVPHSRNFGFEQELSCGILANRCYAYVPTCLAGISFGT